MKLLRRLRAFFRKDSLDREMSEEMRHHLELQVEENIAAGMDPNEARYAAQKSFGGIEQIKEQARDQRGWMWLDQLTQDLRYAVRALAKNRGFTAVAVLTLALGIGTSTAMFSVIYGVLLSPFPYAKPSEIWTIGINNAKTKQGMRPTVGDFLEIAQLPCVETAMATSPEYGMTRSDETSIEFLNCVRLSGSAFPFLGVAPAAGRVFTRTDFKSTGDNEPMAVLSFKLWQRLFSGRADAIGQTILLNNQPHVVIGVMPERFAYFQADLWLPLSTSDRTRNSFLPMIRIKPGIAKEVAEQQLLTLLQRLARESPDRFPKDGFTVRLGNFTEAVPDRFGWRASLQLLFGAVGLLLLIACTNVANLQLARGAGRSREIAVRLAIGASRGRVIRQLLTESIVLSALSGIAGVFLAFGFTQIITALIPTFRVPPEARITINGWVLAYAIGLSLLTGTFFGLVPALRSTKTDLNEALKDGGHANGLGGPSGTRLRHTLVVVEIALSIVLLIGASLAIRGFLDLQRFDRGFNPEHTVWMQIPLVDKRYPTMAQRDEFARELLERIRILPGVTGATIGSLPNRDGYTRASIPGKAAAIEDMMLNYVSEEYFKTWAIPILAGRTFTAQEIAHGDHLVVISASAAKQWPADKNPLGSTIVLDALATGGSPEIKEATVIGIVPDSLYPNLRATPGLAAFVPYTLRGLPTADARKDVAMGRQYERCLVVRTNGEAQALYPALRQAVRSLDKNQPMRGPMDAGFMYGGAFAQPRFNMTLFSGLAGIALALAAAGIYSVLSYSVAQRTREFGVRMALGASTDDILQLVLHGGAKLIILGSVIGFAASLALSQIVSSQVFEVPTLDPWAFGGAVIVLGLIALLACWLPARRATKVDPLVALRHE